jgi:hypothetical protein
VGSGRVCGWVARWTWASGSALDFVLAFLLYTNSLIDGLAGVVVEEPQEDEVEL